MDCENRWTWVDSIDEETGTAAGLMPLLRLCFPTSSVEWRTDVLHCVHVRREVDFFHPY